MFLVSKWWGVIGGGGGVGVDVGAKNMALVLEAGFFDVNDSLGR